MEPEDPHFWDVDHNEDRERDSRYWTDLIDGLSEFPEFQSVTTPITPITIISALNLLVTDYSLQKRNAAMSTMVVKTKDREIGECKKREEILKAKNNNLENHRRHDGVSSESENKCKLLECEKEQLNKSLSEECKKSEILSERCKMLEMENTQYGIELSCKHDALQHLQFNLQATEEVEYPGEFDDKCNQLKTENRLLKEQLAKCRDITAQCLNKPDLSDKVNALQDRCNTLELENKQLILELNCKDDAVLNLKEKEMQLEEYSKKIKELERKYKKSEQHSCPTASAAVSTDKLNQFETKFLLELQQLKEQVSKQNAASLTHCSSHDLSQGVNEIQEGLHRHRYDSEESSLEVRNKELTDQLNEANKKLDENNVILDMLSGKLSSTASELEDEDAHDITVVLKQKDERRTYGISFGRKIGPLTTRESKFYIAKINNSSQEARNLKVGDFVIQINGVNIQQASTAMLDNLLKSSTQTELTLVVRNHKRSYKYKTVCGNESIGKDWGLTLGVFVKDVQYGSQARLLGFREYDEIRKINHQSVSRITLDEINHKMNKYIRFEIQRLNDELFNLPDTIYNHIHMPTIDEYALNNSDDNLYVTATRTYVVSSPQLNSEPIHQTESMYCSYSTNTISLPDNKPLSPVVYPNLNMVELIIEKDYRSFGWELIGGNTTGIYIKKVLGYLPASNAGIVEGWRLHQIEGYRLENVALGFAHDIINSLQSKDRVRVILEKTDDVYYQEKINILPHDSFHIKALSDQRGAKYSIKCGDIFCVKDSYYFDPEDGSTVKWLATTTSTPSGSNVEVIIPSQRAKIILIQEEPGKSPWKVSPKKKSKVHYEILEDVDIAYSEMEDFLVS